MRSRPKHRRPLLVLAGACLLAAVLGGTWLLVRKVQDSVRARQAELERRRQLARDLNDLGRGLKQYTDNLEPFPVTGTRSSEIPSSPLEPATGPTTRQATTSRASEKGPP